MTNSIPLLHHKSGVVRKAAAAVGTGVHRFASFLVDAKTPLYVANSFPKSGTHLLDQIVSSLPNAFDYGRFLSSMTSSFRFQLRSEEETLRYLNRCIPGEVLRAHLFYHASYEAALKSKNAVHYFIYRDPRDVVISEAFYLRDMNRWHRLHPHFSGLSDEEAVNLSIRGMPDREDMYYPDIATRFRCYMPWLQSSECMSVKFEDLVGPQQTEFVKRIVHAACERLQIATEESAVERACVAINPKKSHTFRKAKSGGWRVGMTAASQGLFKETAGDLLVELGYEQGNDWC